MDWIQYHIGEELLIAFICFLLGLKALRIYRNRAAGADTQNSDILSRIYLSSAGFFILSLNSALHSFIHAAELSSNLLFHTLFGYSLGLLLLIASISFMNPSGKKFLPLILYIPFFVIVLPWVYPVLPPFTEFRPLMWVFVAYFSGILVILCIALFRNTRVKNYLFIAIGFLFITLSGIFLFFPSAIGSGPWIHGHLMRPIGFVILLFSVREETFVNLKGSILYRTLTAFSLLAAVPLLFFGIVIFYEEIHPLGITGRRFLIFGLILFTLVAALIFGIGTVIKLIQPILELEKRVASLSRERFEKELTIKTGDEIEELTGAFNSMVSELKKSMREQERLTRLAATGELSARLAHEIRNPLNAIAGSVSYINKNYRGELISEFLRIIQEEVNRINILTTSLLNFSRPILPQPSRADINEVVNETITLINQEYADKQVVLMADLKKDIPPTMFDKDQIKQVIINLMLNALDASTTGQEVVVTTNRVDDSIILSIMDSGKGIRKEDLEHIFKPFYTTKTKGTGLGLAVAERIAKEHGGEITIESTEGGGSTFTLCLPILHEILHTRS